MTATTRGTRLSFYVLENRTHHGIPVYEWLLEHAKKMGIHGGTAWRAMAGFGRHGMLHEQHFFELAGELAVRVDFAVTSEEAGQLLQQVEHEGIPMFYEEFAVTFGVTDGKE